MATRSGVELEMNYFETPLKQSLLCIKSIAVHTSRAEMVKKYFKELLKVGDRGELHDIISKFTSEP